MKKKLAVILLVSILDSVKMKNCLIQTSASDYTSNRELAVLSVNSNIISTKKGSVKMEAAVKSKTGIHYIPVVSFCEAFGYKADCTANGSNYLVSINKVVPGKTGNSNISNSDGTQSKGVRF